MQEIFFQVFCFILASIGILFFNAEHAEILRNNAKVIVLGLFAYFSASSALKKQSKQNNQYNAFTQTRGVFA
jgi:hypothetical protein